MIHAYVQTSCCTLVVNVCSYMSQSLRSAGLLHGPSPPQAVDLSLPYHILNTDSVQEYWQRDDHPEPPRNKVPKWRP